MLIYANWFLNINIILNLFILKFTHACSVMKFAILLLLLSISAQETSSQGKY